MEKLEPEKLKPIDPNSEHGQKIIKFSLHKIIDIRHGTHVRGINPGEDFDATQNILNLDEEGGQLD